MKTVKFYTLGCKVNQYETQAIREQFQRAGFREIEDNAQACVCVINTCTVTHRADSHSLYFIRRAYRQNPGARIVVTGCLTQFDAGKIAAIPGVSLIVRNEDKHRILSLLDDRLATGYSLLATPLGITYFKNHTRAFLKIQDGCNYRCSYCKVALARGRSRSKPLSGIKNEAASLVKKGYKEIVLCGVCLGSYGKDLVPRLSLTKVIEELKRLPGCFRIRLSSIELNDITDDLIHIVSESDRLCRHLHIPLQSGDREILRLMNRAYSPEQYLELIERTRRYIPEISITTDAMVGFPGETETAFRNTVELIKEIGPLRVHIFPYSKRENTPAYNFREPVPEGRKKKRLANLKEITQALGLAYREKFISSVCEVLVERKVFGSSDLWEGYTGNYIKVRVKSNLKLKNQLMRVRLKEAYKDFVLAEIA